MSSMTTGPQICLPHTDLLLNHAIDSIARSSPDTIYGEWPEAETTYGDGFRHVSFRQIAAAIDYIANWLVREIGLGQSFETLAYIGVNNIAYIAVVLGAVKAGYKVLLLSPRNSVAAQIHLLKATQCTRLLTPARRPPSVIAIVSNQDGQELSVHEVPSVNELLECEWKSFPFKKTLDNAASDPLVVMHTSGSTGFPKPIVWKQTFPPAYAKQWQLQPPPGTESVDSFYKGTRVFFTLPPFHAAFWAIAVINGVYNRTRMIFPLSGAISTAGQLGQALDHTRIDTAFLIPVMMNEFGERPELIDRVAAGLTQKRVVCTGGDVPERVGSLITQKLDIVNFYGTSEFASLAFTRPTDKPREDWRYFSFHPDVGIDLRPFSGKVCELVLTRSSKGIEHQAVFTTFPHEKEWHTRDLWTPHPTKPGLWAHSGRADDIIVFNTSEKMNPVPFEQIVGGGHGEISGILLVGSNRFQASLLVELANRKSLTESEKEQFIDKIWSSVQLANKDCPAHAQVTRSYIFFTRPDKPMRRSPKGTIQRAATLSLYAEDLDSWYDQARNKILLPLEGSVPDVEDFQALASYIRVSVRSITAIERKDTENFFLSGMDSLQALILAQSIGTALNDPKITPNTVYKAPSVLELTSAIQTGAGKTQAHLQQSNEPSTQPSLSSLLHQLLSKVDEIPPTRHLEFHDKKQTPVRVLLTGTTGSLGLQILLALLETPQVEHVYCVNRAADGGLSKYRVDGAVLDTNRTSFFQLDATKPTFGLPSRSAEAITHIIHNAWNVNFNTPLSAFEEQLEGIITLIRFANSSPNRPSISFLSSVSAVSNFQVAKIPEVVIDDISAPEPMGYGESKYIGERLLERASKHLGLDTQVLRVGQVAGSLKRDTAIWHRHEWFPSLIRSSSYISLLPDSLPGILGNIDWIPIDELSNVINELVLYQHADVEPQISDTASGVAASVCKTFNLVNKTVAWGSLVPMVIERLPGKVGIVSFSEWLEAVRDQLAKDLKSDRQDLAAALKANPAGKLLKFFETSNEISRKITWERENAAKVSDTFKGLEEIRGESVKRWVSEWLEE